MLISDLCDRWCNLIKESGYRLTSPRKTIVEILAKSDCALGALDLFEQGIKEHPGLGLVTVYRTIEKLEELGLIQRVHQPGGCHRYFRSATEHQHILLCTNCGNSVFFSGDELSPLFAGVADTSGYEIRDHWLQLFGICPACRTTDEFNTEVK
jgi:Fur family transcriptional regulator, ferric uptake regulator